MRRAFVSVEGRIDVIALPSVVSSSGERPSRIR